MKSSRADGRGVETAADSDGGRDERPDRPVRVRVVTRGLLLGLLATAFAASRVLDPGGPPAPTGFAAFATLTKGKGVVEALALSADGKSLAVAMTGERVTIWDVASQRRRHVLPVLSLGMGLAFSPDGEVLAIADKSPTIGLWHAETGEKLGTLDCPGRRFVQLAYSPDGRTLAASGVDDSVTLWDVSTARVRHAYQGGCVSRDTLAFSPDGRSLAFTGRGGTIVVVDARSRRVRAEFPGHTSRVQTFEGRNVSNVFSPDGQVLASQGAFDPLVKLWSVADGRLIATIDVEPSLGRIVALSTEGRTVLLEGQGTVWEWDRTARRSKVLVAGVSRFQPHMEATPDGETLAIVEGRQIALLRRTPHLRADADTAPFVLKALPDGREGEGDRD